MRSRPLLVNQKRAELMFRSNILWYSLPWSFEEFFQLLIPSRCIHEREIYASPSSSNKIIPSNVQTLNGRGDMTFLLNPPDLRTITLEYRDQGHFHHINSTFCVKIPTYRIIETNCLDTLHDCLFTTNLRFVHIRFYLSLRFAVTNWNSLHTLSVLPLLKPLRLTGYNLETVLEDKDCQVIVKRLPMLTDFIFCFRRNIGPIDDKNDSFDIHRKSILNLHRHICNLLLDQQPKIIIETDGCGLMIWL
jgi:hypothetical protein